MRILRKKRLITLVALLVLALHFTSADAFTRNFVYDFTHHIPGPVYNGTKSKINISLKVTSWGSSSFTIKQVKSGIFSSTTYATKNIAKKNGNKQTISFSNHGGCQYQFWKASDGKRIIGTGTIVW